MCPGASPFSPRAPRWSPSGPRDGSSGPIVEGRGPTHGGRFVNPKVTWPTSEASPSGDAIIHGRLYVASRGAEARWRMRIHGTRLGRKTRLLHGRLGRLRTVIRAPSGRLWIATSN